MNKRKKTIPYTAALVVLILVLVIGYTQLDGDRRARFFGGVAVFMFSCGAIWYLFWVRKLVKRQGSSIVTAYVRRKKRDDESLPGEYQDLLKGVEEAIRSSIYFSGGFRHKLERLDRSKEMMVYELPLANRATFGQRMLQFFYDFSTREKRYRAMVEMIHKLEDR